MKALKICSAGLVILLFLASCNLRPGRIGQDVQSAPLTATFTPTFTKIPSTTPIIAATSKPTFTPFPSPTRGPSITPFPSSTPIPANILLDIQAEVTKARFSDGAGSPYRCKLISTEPSELEVLRPREEFAGIWRIKNVGKPAWTTTNFAYFYISGSKFQTQKYKEQFIPYVVNEKDQLNIHVPMRAPAEPGVYFTIWGLRIKSLRQFFCTFAISIVVEEKNKK